MSLELFATKLQHYCRVTGNSRKTLAHELGLHPSLLSHKLNSSNNRTLTHTEVKAIVKILAKWEAISSQEEALELLALVNCPPFAAQEWSVSPLNQLEAAQTSPYDDDMNSMRSAGRGEAPSPGTRVSANTTSGYQPVKGSNHNLPNQLSTFIGREEEKTEVRRLLFTTRLLTLTGAGGVGKTRLALEVAAQSQASFADGVWLVELAGLNEPGFVPQAVGEALGVREERVGVLPSALTGYLRDKSLLLVLDNCEHLLSASTQLAQSLLSACPNLRILATSRENFDIAGEYNYLVPSLSLPPAGLDFSHSQPGGTELRQTISRYEAIELFIERAQAAQPNFEINNQNILLIVQICRQLDGIPLALELAASKVRLLAVDQIADLLADRFSLLKRSHQGTIPRHQTLQALLDWSYDLVSASEQTVLQRLSILRGSWNLAAAEAICASSARADSLEINIAREEVLVLLIQLVNKSLVLAVQPQVRVQSQSEGSITVGTYLNRQEMRYRLLESVREYGLKKLTERNEADQVKARHLNFFVALAEEIAPQLASTSRKQAGLEKLDAEYDNIRLALDWAINNRKWEESLRLGVALYRFWRNRDYLSEGRRWLELGLAQAEEVGEPVPVSLQAEVLFVAGQMAHYQGDYEGARAYLEQCLVLRRELGDKRNLADTLQELSSTVVSLGDNKRASALAEESFELFRDLGDKQGLAQLAEREGRVLFEQGDYEGAQRHIRKALKLILEVGNKEIIAGTLWWMGVLTGIKDEDRAITFYERSLALYRELGKKSGISSCLMMLGEIRLFQGDYLNANRLLEESLLLRREIGLEHGRIIHIQNDLGYLQNDLGYLELFQGNYPEAFKLFAGGLKASNEDGNIRQIVKSLMGLASLSVEQGQALRATRLFGAATAFRGRNNFLIPAIELVVYNNLVNKAKAVLDETAFKSAWEEGQKMELNEAINDALELELY